MTNSKSYNSYAAIPLEVNNYYPFGALMSENSWKYSGILEADGVNDASPYYYDPYTYAFQQMQRDNGTKSGNDLPGYTTLFRGYDTEGGRWNQIDPKWRELPSESPYCGMENNPVNMVDPWGDATYYTDDEETHNIDDKDNNLYIISQKAWNESMNMSHESKQSFIKQKRFLLFDKKGVEKLDREFFPVLDRMSMVEPTFIYGIDKDGKVQLNIGGVADEECCRVTIRNAFGQLVNGVDCGRMILSLLYTFNETLGINLYTNKVVAGHGHSDGLSDRPTDPQDYNHPNPIMFNVMINSKTHTMYFLRNHDCYDVIKSYEKVKKFIINNNKDTDETK